MEETDSLVKYCPSCGVRTILPDKDGDYFCVSCSSIWIISKVKDA